ncbi:MAG: Mur ligase family protein [Flavobacteriales bacterium]|jgi:UDP-N-acetylmuramate--alanine ligase|nr:Mur ligase family protein [Flavobacteriales bacterium]
MNTLLGHKLFFIGAGGIGMSGLARYFRRQGAEVAGYDRTPTELTNQLQSEGIAMQFSEDPRLLPPEFRDAPPGTVAVVRTPAVPAGSPLLRYWEQRGARILKRAEVLGMVTRDRRTVAVAGTHGKTTVSTMLAHLLTTGGVPCNAFLGGIANNYGTNVLLNDRATVNVVEADEYDRSFLQLRPTEAIITAMDPDHLEVYGTPEAMFRAYTEFAALCTGTMLAHERIAHRFAGRPGLVAYALDSERGPHAARVRVEGGTHRFDLVAGDRTITDLRLAMPGRHNVENAVAASVMALHMGVGEEDLRKGLAGFRGVARRFDVHLNDRHAVLIDDYAHHPVEVAACLRSVRELHPGRHLTAVFQPHLFSRTRDLGAELAESLELADALLLMPIYPAREEAIPGITSEGLLDRVRTDDKRIVRADELVEVLRARDSDVVVMMGAGDIDRSVPAVRTMLNEQRRP